MGSTGVYFYSGLEGSLLSLESRGRNGGGREKNKEGDVTDCFESLYP